MGKWAEVELRCSSSDSCIVGSIGIKRRRDFIVGRGRKHRLLKRRLEVEVFGRPDEREGEMRGEVNVPDMNWKPRGCQEGF